MPREEEPKASEEASAEPHPDLTTIDDPIDDPIDDDESTNPGLATFADGTLAVHAGEPPDPLTGALDAPIVLSNAYAFADAEDAAAQFRGERPGHIYSRWRNPTVAAFEEKVAHLERGEAAVALASGMAAIHGVFAAMLQSGDHVVAPLGLYAETGKVLREQFHRFGVETTFVDGTDVGAMEAAMRPETRLVWVETPANPTLGITDIEAVARFARAAGALVVVDNTFATPWHQRPLTLGADLVVHSATKAIGGHGDAVGGVVCGARAHIDEIRRVGVRGAGGAMSPMTAYLLARGARTLGLRQERASQTAATLAARLAEDPRVAVVHYPGLERHPGHEVAVRQMQRGFGALVAYELHGGVAAGRAAYDAFRLITRAVSLGDVRTLVTHPAATTHASVPEDVRRAAGIGDGLMRLAVGIEDVEDLWRDIERAHLRAASD